MSSVASIWLSQDTSVMASKLSAQLRRGQENEHNYTSIDAFDGDVEKVGQLLAYAYRRLITLTASDTTMHCVAVVPLWADNAAERLDTVSKAVAAGRNSMSLHVIALSCNLSKVCGISPANGKEDDDRTIFRNLTAIPASTVGCTFSLIEDYAANGAALNFTLLSLCDYIGVFFNALTRNYDRVFPQAMVIGNADVNYAIGISSLRFDEKDAIDYLLHKAFLSKLDSQNVNDDNVDTQSAINYAQKLLNGSSSRYENFYQKKVMTLFRDEKLDEKEVAAKARPLLEEELHAIETELTSCLNDNSLSFPAKEAIISLILGRDNNRLTGSRYDADTAIVDDYIAAPLDLYINAFNRLCPGSGMLPLRGRYNSLKLYITDPDSLEIIESPENFKAFNPISDLKALKRKICNNTEFLRRKTAELEKLLEAENRNKKVREQSADGNIERRTVDAEVREKPLDAQYVPPKGLKILPSVDLRTYFSPIKNQGKIGSCTSFAVTAIYESIMNRAAGDNEERADMSERFLFYWSNIVTGHPEGGSTYAEQLGVAGKYGLCREIKYQYSAIDLGSAPTDDAIKEASKHRVLKALQIPLRNDGNVIDCIAGNHALLTSALSEGHAVGIGLKVYDSFQDKGAFINRPDDTDVSSGGEGYHAMVLVGYSEAEKCYIVRNSWGSEWGDNGYAYISSAYIDDPEYNNFACIITETTENTQTATVPEMTANFGGTETEIKIASIRNIIDEVNLELRVQKDMYRDYYEYYSTLLEKVSLPGTQSKLQKLAEKETASQLQSIRDDINRLKKDYAPSIRNYKKSYRKIGYYISSGAVAWILLTILPLTRNYLWIWIVAGVHTLLTVFYWLNYRWAWRRYRRLLQERINNLASRELATKRDFMEKQLEYHISGMWMSAFHDLLIRLNTTLDRLISYNKSLRGWYEEDEKAIATPVKHEGAMFFYLGNPNLYGEYFLANIRHITDRIDLMQVFEDYTVSSISMSESRARLDKNTRQAIATLFNDFSVAEYLLGHKYPYISEQDVSDMIKLLILASQPSLRFDTAGTTPPLRSIFISGDEDTLAQIRRLLHPFFSYNPQIESGDKPVNLDIVTIQPVSV